MRLFAVGVSVLAPSDHEVQCSVASLVHLCIERCAGLESLSEDCITQGRVCVRPFRRKQEAHLLDELNRCVSEYAAAFLLIDAQRHTQCSFSGTVRRNTHPALAQALNEVIRTLRSHRVVQDHAQTACSDGGVESGRVILPGAAIKHLTHV